MSYTHLAPNELAMNDRSVFSLSSICFKRCEIFTTFKINKLYPLSFFFKRVERTRVTIDNKQTQLRETSNCVTRETTKIKWLKGGHKTFFLVERRFLFIVRYVCFIKCFTSESLIISKYR